MDDYKKTYNEYVGGNIAFLENEQLNECIAAILREKRYKLQKKLLIDLKEEAYQSDLAYSHIQYYIDRCNQITIRRRKRFLWVSGILIFVALAIWLTIYVYIRSKAFELNDEAYLDAVEYYEKGDYDPAFLRLKALAEDGQSGYGIYYYLSLIYEKYGQTRDAYDTIIYFLDNFYGRANVIEYEPVITRLSELDQFSEKETNELWDITFAINDYKNQKKQVDESVYYENWTDAVYNCELLQSEGANNYELTTKYVYSLIQLNESMKAFNYLENYFSSMTPYERKTIVDKQKEALIESTIYALEGKSNEEKEELVKEYKKKYITSDAIKAIENTPYNVPANVFLSEEEAKKLLIDVLGMANYYDIHDTIESSEENPFYNYDTLVYGNEGFYFTVEKNESNKKYYYFVSRNGHFVYIYMPTEESKNEWICLNENDDSFIESDIRIPNNTSELYTDDPGQKWIYKNDQHPNLTLEITSCGEDDLKLDFKNNNKIILSNHSFFRNYGYYMEILSGSRKQFNEYEGELIWGRKPILLIERDINNQLNMFEGSYTNTTEYDLNDNN